MSKEEVLVLMSGGMDSLACAHFYQEYGWNVQGIFIDYGQRAARNEEKAVDKLATYLQIPISKARIAGLSHITSGLGLIQGRNGALLMLGLMSLNVERGSVAIGIHSGTDYADCSVDFLKLSQKIFDLYTDGQVTVGAPFISWSKSEIQHYCDINKLPLEMSYSCEFGNDRGCGVCNSCKDRNQLNVSKV